jgi:hypothetical protein
MEKRCSFSFFDLFVRIQVCEIDTKRSGKTNSISIGMETLTPYEFRGDYAASFVPPRNVASNNSAVMTANTP